MAKATPTIIRLTVSVVVNRDEYVKEYGGDIPKKSDLTTALTDTIESVLGESEFGKQTAIYTVDVL